MKKFNQLWLGLTICVLWSCSVWAQTDSTAIYVKHILAPPHDSARMQAIQRLVVLRQPATFPLLAAIQDKRLYLRDGKAITTGIAEAQPDGTEVFPLYSVFPENKPLLVKGQPQKAALADLQAIEVSRAERLTLVPVMPYLTLAHPDPKKRMMAYSQVYSLSDSNKTTMLRQALSIETNTEALRTGREVLYQLQLNQAASPAEAKVYIDSLSENWGDNASTILNEYAQSASHPREAVAYAVEKARSLDTKQQYIQRAQNFFSGMSLGSILILIALGLSIVYGLAGVINMAHGEFLMIGAYTTYCVQVLFIDMLGITQTDWFFIAALPVSFIIAGIWGFVLERLVIRHLYSRPLESLLATWGVSLILVQTARSLFGDLTAVKAPALLAGGWQILPHLVLPYNRLFIIGLTIIVVALTYLMLYRSRLGIQIRAVTQNRNMSACLGIETKRVDAITFFLGSGLAGLAGCAMTLIGNVVPDMGQTYIVDSFLVVVTGGVGKIVGTILSGVGIGFLTKVLESFYEAVYGKVLILAVIILFLQFKPKGMFPDKGRIAED